MEVNILLRIVNILGWRVSQVTCLATGTYYPVGWWHHLDIFYPNGISYEYKRNAHCCTNISDGKFDNGSTWLRTTLASCLTCLSFDTGQWVRAVRWLEWFLFLFLDSNGLYSHSYFFMSNIYFIFVSKYLEGILPVAPQFGKNYIHRYCYKLCLIIDVMHLVIVDWLLLDVLQMHNFYSVLLFT